MKYSLRSLMIVAAVGPAILAGILFSLRELFSLEEPGSIILGAAYFALCVLTLPVVFRKL